MLGCGDVGGGYGGWRIGGRSSRVEEVLSLS